MNRLEQRIQDWRDSLRDQGVPSHALAELEGHLRESIDQLIRSGLTEIQAFESAVERLGPAATLGPEFRKLEPAWWPIKGVIAVGIGVAVAMLILVATRFQDHSSGLVLAIHVFTVTLGYVSSFLIGALGICFVCQRFFSGFAASRLESVSRLIFKLGAMGACLTALGIVLGMVWTKREWGRLWAWDLKETTGLAVFLWQLAFLGTQRWRRLGVGGVLRLSLVGNILVLLAWFGPALFGGLHNYGSSPRVLLALAVGINLVILLLGMSKRSEQRLFQDH